MNKLLSGVALAAGLTAAAAADEFTWRREASSLALQAGTGTVWAFHWGADATKPYFHPIALPGGPALTGHRPADHRWHLGVWFSWKFINGVNYWEEDAKTGKPAGLTLWSNVTVEARDDFSARVTMDLSYAPAGQPAVLGERRVIEVSRPAADGRYEIAWRADFTAGPRDLNLAATPVNANRTAGGYGGLIWRVAAELTDWEAINAEGLRDLAAHGEPTRALDFSGRRDDRTMGLAMFDHPANPGHPTAWFLRMDAKKPYGLHGPGVLFKGPLRLPAETSMTLRYDIVVHPGRWDAATLQAAHAAP